MKTSAFALLAVVAALPVSLAQDTDATTPGGPAHSTLPAVPIPDDTSSSYPSTDISTGSLITSTANYSSSLTLSTTTTAPTTTTVANTTTTDTISTSSTVSVSTATDVATTSVVIITPTGSGGALTSTQVVVLPPASQSPAATTTPGQLVNAAEKLHNGVQAAALAGLVAVCGIMGML